MHSLVNSLKKEYNNISYKIFWIIIILLLLLIIYGIIQIFFCFKKSCKHKSDNTYIRNMTTSPNPTIMYHHANENIRIIKNNQNNNNQEIIIQQPDNQESIIQEIELYPITSRDTMNSVEIIEQNEELNKLLEQEKEIKINLSKQ